MPNPPPKRAGPPWRKRLAIALALLVVASVVGRVALRAEARAGSETPPSASGLVPDAPPADSPPPEERKGLPAALPYVTEGGLAMLLGIGLGIATRAVYKLAIVLLALLFVALQYLAHKGVLAVDWGAFAKWLETSVLNVAGGNGMGAIVRHKLPSAASLALGLYLGLKR